MIKRKLPIGGVQVFSDLRRKYDVYVDKTMHIYNMASRYRTVFLSRPRRFGKSLLCTTIESLFSNQKELFEGLAISRTDWEWEKHPVIHLKLGAGDFTKNGIASLDAEINSQLKECAKNYGVDIDFTEYISVNFSQLMIELSQKLNRVVVIVDEYDSPLLTTINQSENNAELRERLKGFYSVIKQNEQYLQFAFVTGVTKFAQVSLFSGMNQVKDISMMPEYCDICGITQEELEKYFEPEIENYAKNYGGRENYLNKLKEYYNGYFFTEKKLSVYNTYGILNHFDEEAKFDPYWSMSGAPSFILKYLETKKVDIVEIEDARMKAGGFSDYRDNTITLFPLLYQAGYLTISDYDDRTGLYSLNYPNIEVRQTLAQFLANNYANAYDILNDSVSVQFIDALLEGNIDKFMDLLKWYLNTVDYSLSGKITEYYFEFAVSNIINMLGLDCRNEVHTANGRMDSVIFAGDYIYILEFKVDKPVENAVMQIKKKDYALKYANNGKKIAEVGIVFSREQRNIVEWKLL